MASANLYIGSPENVGTLYLLIREYGQGKSAQHISAQKIYDSLTALKRGLRAQSIDINNLGKSVLTKNGTHWEKFWVLSYIQNLDRDQTDIMRELTK